MAEVEIVEVGPRDGLQNEARNIPTTDRVRLIEALAGAGFRRIEAASFVSPRWVPQMADGAEVMAQVPRRAGLRYLALVPNLKGWDVARAAGVDEVAVFAAATDGFARANLNATVEESFERLAPVVEAAKAAGRSVRGYVSVVTDCPYEGAVEPGAVARVAARLWAMGCDEIALGETLGRGVPERVDAMLGAVLEEVPADGLAGHFHDTAGRALLNVEVALEWGLRVFDASVAGLGGCPFAPGAKGNVATEALADHLAALGYAHGLNRWALERAAFIARSLREDATVADHSA